MTTDAAPLDAEPATAAGCPSTEPLEPGRLLACSRRALLRRAGAGGAVLGSVGLLAACGGTEDTATSATSTSSGASSEPASTPSGSSSAADGGSGAGVAAADVPEGSAVVVEVDGEQVVLAQPTAGEYVAFSAVCTHQGAIVAADSGTQVTCPLHGSVFDAGDGGAVLEGPATEPLEELTVTVEGDQLVVA